MPVLNARVTGWLADPNILKSALLASVGPAWVKVVGALRLLKLLPTCTFPVLAMLPQADGGIRPPYVSGVQTCALPILKAPVIVSAVFPSSATVPVALFVKALLRVSGAALDKIGRASCRERV